MDKTVNLEKQELFETVSTAKTKSKYIRLKENPIGKQVCNDSLLPSLLYIFTFTIVLKYSFK